MSIVSSFSTFVVLFVLVFSFNFCVLFYAFECNHAGEQSSPEHKQILEKYRAILLIVIISVAILSLLGIITESKVMVKLVCFCIVLVVLFVMFKTALS